MTVQTRIALVLLGATLMLWLLAVLYLLRIADIFNYYLVKRLLGANITFGAMALCPLVAMLLGFRMVRDRRTRALGGAVMGTGGFLVLAFVVVIGVPLFQGRMEAGTPKNPTTPRRVEPQTGLPVFPGAEGFGTRTPAGRGGKVIEVTSLADSGPGTFREALSAPFRRIVVFRVGGTIEVSKAVVVDQPFVTVAGQTSPGDGICIKNAGLVIVTHDVLVQHIRIRPGNEGRVNADTNDAVEVLGKHGSLPGAYNVVLDHISASWSEDETISTWFGPRDVTISWSIISEALNRSRHRKRTHSAGLLIGDSSEHVSIHHCLLAHNDFRNPLISGGGTHDIVNNVIYNWGVLPAEVCDSGSNSFLNFVGNCFLPGPSTKATAYEVCLNHKRGEGNPKVYVEDNIGPHRPKADMDEWSLVSFGWGEDSPAPQTYRASQAFAAHPVSKLPAAEALARVLAEAGATAPKRDAVDARIVADVTNKTGRIIDSPKQVGGHPKLSSGTPPLDSDGDGMPDEWESGKGLNPNDPSDGNKDRDGDGYTNIEEYLHSLLK